ncbi:MAG: 5-formyltetrahydrofolate cyclo-ligase [Phycisphaeraceae bacterium]|nr:5-formyltetrahydrofolate cyclo-ligase [Phycisphaeraceae bacterium]
MDKAELRQNLRNGLLDMSSEMRRQKSLQACSNLVSLPQFTDSSTVMIFLSLSYEVDTAAAIEQAWSQGKTVVVPRTSRKQRTMDPIRIESFQEEFSVSPFGLRTPVSQVVVPLEEIDLVVAPGLGFDVQGNRLGQGGGYYDRFLCRPQLKARRCGFAFDQQVVPCVPCEDTDQTMEFLVTDKQSVSVVSQA